MCVCVCVCVWGRREEEERYPGSQRYFLVTELGQQMQNAIPLRSIKWAIGLIYNVSLTGVSQWEWNQSLVVLWGEDLFMQTFHRHLISGPRNLRPIRFRIRFQRSIQHILQHALLSLSFFFFFWIIRRFSHCNFFQDRESVSLLRALDGHVCFALSEAVKLKALQRIMEIRFTVGSILIWTRARVWGEWVRERGSLLIGHDGLKAKKCWCIRKKTKGGETHARTHTHTHTHTHPCSYRCKLICSFITLLSSIS